MTGLTCRRIPVFFYGLFMDADALRAKGLHPVHPRRACVRGFALRIGRRASLVPEPEASVHGALMELSHDEIDRLYAEPSVREYRPEAVLAELDDAAQIPALCFNLPVPPSHDQENKEYVQKLKEVAARAGLPEDYVKRIR
ncbi:MAG: gamma-glutamylcyclotransferase [Acidobacteria bacterium]|nr:gamma-glutamylcyclotransferase [Acidobacteriota bacterium]